MTHCFVINPNAGYCDNSELLKSEIRTVFRRMEQNYEIYFTKGNNLDKEFLQKRCQEEEKIRFYACGGDGTVHDIVNSIYGFDNASFAVIPCGTGNDYIKSIGGYTSLKELMMVGNETIVDLIDVNNILCMNIVSVGLDAQINANTMKYKKNPLFKGIAYYLGVIESVLGKLGHSVEINIDDEGSFKTDILMLAVAKGHYYGKTFHAAPLSDIIDRQIDVCLIKKISLPKIVKLIPIYQKGKHVNNEKVADVISYQKSKKVTIKSDVSFPLNIDGELFQETKVEIKILPKAIRLYSLYASSKA